MTLWALLIMLAGDASGLPRASWHATLEACQQQAAVEAIAAHARGARIEAASCIPHDRRLMQPATGEILTR
jgi:hypothetical protein